MNNVACNCNSKNCTFTLYSKRRGKKRIVSFVDNFSSKIQYTKKQKKYPELEVVLFKFENKVVLFRSVS